MAGVGAELAERLAAVLLTDSGQPFDLATAEARLRHALAKLRALQDAEPGAAPEGGGM